VIFTVFTIKATAQHEPRLNVYMLFAGQVELEYEYATENFGYQMGVGYQIEDGFLGEGVGYNAILLTPEFRYYWDPDEDASRWHVSAYLRYRQTWESPSQVNTVSGQTIVVDQTSVGLAVGPAIGYKWVTRSGFSTSLYLGIGYYALLNFSYGDIDQEQIAERSLDAIQNDIFPADIRLGISLGYRFE
jgi:hypothetical protein